jgi:hypothetical protein
MQEKKRATRPRVRAGVVKVGCVGAVTQGKCSEKKKSGCLTLYMVMHRAIRMLRPIFRTRSGTFKSTGRPDGHHNDMGVGGQRVAQEQTEWQGEMGSSPAPTTPHVRLMQGV